MRGSRLLDWRSCCSRPGRKTPVNKPSHPLLVGARQRCMSLPNLSGVELHGFLSFLFRGSVEGRKVGGLYRRETAAGDRRPGVPTAVRWPRENPGVAEVVTDQTADAVAASVARAAGPRPPAPPRKSGDPWGGAIFCTGAGPSGYM
jgi:hypothetical protein